METFSREFFHVVFDFYQCACKINQSFGGRTVGPTPRGVSQIKSGPRVLFCNFSSQPGYNFPVFLTTRGHTGFTVPVPRR